MGCQQIPAKVKLGFNDYHIRFVKWDCKAERSLADGGDNISGSLPLQLEQVADGETVFKWSLTLQPSPEELDIILPEIGFNLDTGVYKRDVSAMTAAGFPIQVGFDSEVRTYTGCKIDTARLYCRKGKGDAAKLHVQLDGFAKDVSVSGSFSVTNALAQGLNYVFSEEQLDLGTVVNTYNSSFQLTLMNALNVEFWNSTRAVCIEPTQDLVFLQCETPYISTTKPLLSGNDISTAGIAGEIRLARGSHSFEIAIPKMVSFAEQPGVVSRREGEVQLPFRYQAFKAGSGELCTITNTIP